MQAAETTPSRRHPPGSVDTTDNKKPSNTDFGTNNGDPSQNPLGGSGNPPRKPGRCQTQLWSENMKKLWIRSTRLQKVDLLKFVTFSKQVSFIS